METAKGKTIRLERLKVRNLKALDSLDLEFPRPRQKRDPDILVLGSKNGLGKTSVLESCALLLLAASGGEKVFKIRPFREMPVNFGDLLVRAGTDKAVLQGTFSSNGQKSEVTLTLSRSGTINVEGDTSFLKGSLRSLRPGPREAAERFWFSLVALSTEPILLPPLIYFHSYRKVREGNPDLGMMLEQERVYGVPRYRPGIEFPVSTFKLELLRSMMSQADLFETIDDRDAGDRLAKLNDLMRRYADGTIEKLRPSGDNTLDFRIVPTGGNAQKSFTFDGLSSGQKEIISTLFLVWRYSMNTPSIVLIDEPELHLNVEWHSDFIHQIHTLAPRNQYIIATHSEEVFGSVPEDRRLLLVGSGDDGR